MRRLSIILAASLLAGCESAAKKAERLRAEQSTACAEASMIATSNLYPHAAKDAAQAKCDVATRNFNAFMSGR